MKNRLITLLKTTGIAYLLICVLMTACQRQIMYHPFTAIGSGGPAEYGLAGFTGAQLKDEDGTHIAAWYAQGRAGYPTLVFFHGNGGNMGSRTDYFSALRNAGFGVLAIDYRGYGASEGSPSEQGFYQDARAAMHYALATLHVPSGALVPYGESIGTGVAVQMALEFPAGAFVLQSPYTSVEAVAQARYPWLPVSLLIQDRFDSIDKIGKIHTPLLLFHGEADTIIPLVYGKALFAKANEPKQAVYFPGRGHNDLDINERVNALLLFSREHGLIKE